MPDARGAQEARVRRCADCPASLAGRHRNAVRCHGCARSRRLAQATHSAAARYAYPDERRRKLRVQRAYRKRPGVRERVAAYKRAWAKANRDHATRLYQREYMRRWRAARRAADQ